MNPVVKEVGETGEHSQVDETVAGSHCTLPVIWNFGSMEVVLRRKHEVN